MINLIVNVVQHGARLDHPKADVLVGLGMEEVHKDTTIPHHFREVDNFLPVRQDHYGGSALLRSIL